MLTKVVKELNWMHSRWGCSLLYLRPSKMNGQIGLLVEVEEQFRFLTLSESTSSRGQTTESPNMLYLTFLELDRHFAFLITITLPLNTFSTFILQSFCLLALAFNFLSVAHRSFSKWVY